MSDELSFPSSWKSAEPSLDFVETDVPAAEPEFLVRPVQPKVLMMEAARATTDNLTLLAEWVRENGGTANLQGDRLYLQTLDGPFTIRPGDDVVRGPQGFFRTDPELKMYEDVRRPGR